MPKAGLKIPAVKIFINTKFVNSTDYTVTNNLIDLSAVANIGDFVEIRVISDDTSEIGLVMCLMKTL